MTDMTNTVPCLRLLASTSNRDADDPEWFCVGDYEAEDPEVDLGELMFALTNGMEEGDEPITVSFKLVMLTDKQVEALN